MSDLENDRLLDARLCDVPVPDALSGRLRGIAEPSDHELDQQLVDVPLPKGLTHRLRQVVADERLDRQLREVPLPHVALARARIIPQRRKRSTAGRFALAACLMLAFSLGFWSSLGGMLVAVRTEPQPATSLFVLDESPLELVSTAAVVEATIELGPVPLGGDRGPSDSAGQIVMLAMSDRVAPGPAGILFTEMGRLWDPGANWMRLRWPLLGYLQPEVETLPDLERVGLPVGRGFSTPLTRAFDREFLYSRGAQPPVLIGADQGAGRVAVPLVNGTDSYDGFRRWLGRSRLPPPDEVRAEEFLAALDYGLPPAEPGKVALRTAAGPSVFNPYTAGLLQIAAKAGSPVQTCPATHLTVALDLSASMEWGQRLDAARQGLLRALAQLRPQDRFSLIAFREEPFLLVSEARRADLPKIYDLLSELRPGGGCDLNEAVQQALVAALDSDGGAPADRRLVLITDSASGLSQDAARGLGNMLRAAAKRAFRFDVLDLSDRDESSERLGTRWLTELAVAGGGAVRHVRTPSQIRWHLVETLHAAPALVASEVKLQVEFNPQAVAAYRLIGHEARSSGGLMPGEGRVELHAGEEATALFELWLYPNDEDEVAQARLEWTDPQTGRVRSTQPQRISRVQFATSFEGAAVNLQQAAIAAEAAEVLSHGFNFSLLDAAQYRYEPKPRGLQHVLQAARRANPQLSQRPDFRQLLQSLEAAERLALERSPALARSGSRGIIAGRWRESRE